MSDCGCGLDDVASIERRTLIVLFLINGSMFAAELVFGLIAHSTGLIADSLDMLADAAVYGISLYAVAKTSSAQTAAAKLSGVLQVVLGFGVIVEVFRRSVSGSEPESLLMIVVAAVALVANISCVVLLSKHRDSGVHMRASWIFSTNDVIANVGVIIAGVLVWVSGSRIPDLVIGAAISAVVINGGIKILKEASKVQQAGE